MSAYNNYGEDIDEMMSPSFDLTNAQNKSFTFKVAAASTSTATSTLKDELKVYFSTNCGSSWIPRATYTTTTLFNNPASTSGFVANASTVWTQNTIAIPAIFQTSNMRVKFSYKSSYLSNNIYIDDINISETVGIDENKGNGLNFIIYPNPSNESATLSYGLTTESKVTVQVLDVLGKTVFQTASATLSEGNYTFTISKREQNLANGVYFVKLIVNDKIQTKKLIISE